MHDDILGLAYGIDPVRKARVRQVIPTAGNAVVVFTIRMDVSPPRRLDLV